MRGKQSIGRKTYPSATSFTTNPTITEPGLNPCLRGVRPATKNLNHSTVLLPYHERLFQHICVDVVNVYTVFSTFSLLILTLVGARESDVCPILLKGINRQAIKAQYNATFRSVRATIAVVEKQ